MTLFCFCDFRFGAYFDWSDLWSLIGAAVGAALGAYLGFLAASRIYKRERKDKAEEERQLNQHLCATAKMLIEQAAHGSRILADACTALLAKYEAEPYGLHIRPIAVNTPLITLDRMNRERLLRAYESVLGKADGLELWRETWKFSDGLMAYTAFSQQGVLSGQQEAMATAEKLGTLGQELIVLGSYVAEEAQATGNANPAVPKLIAILDDTFEMGFVTADVMNVRLLEPITNLFRKRLLTIVNATRFTETFAKARSAYQRYGQVVVEVKDNLGVYAKQCREAAIEGEGIGIRMNAAMNGADERI